MAGITAFPFKLFNCHDARVTTSPFCLFSSFDSRLFGLPLSNSQVGVVSIDDAIQMAGDDELDLVILSPDADPPVVRIMNYSKYRYEQQKKERGQQKKSAANRMDLKELKMGYNIDEHDYSVRLKAARKFLKDGDKVKVK